ncbi:hypothetical protein [Lewinella sp. W8]|uniref:hypothetical protein n=1 Tax=Lewinella sp. W8 TaxID=2528208 RepID=UPI001068B8EF|nr:hypothetical protein [Lewinella sp. W8]MTB50919.1 hypothetical protein [Lewinella sp. W8]
MARTLLLLAFLLISVFSFAQSRNLVTEGYTEFKKERYNSLNVSIDASYDLVADYLEDFWDDRYEIDVDKFDKDKNALALSAEQVGLPRISDKNFDLYLKAAESGRSTTVSASVVFAENDVVTSQNHATAYRATEGILEEFYQYFYSRYFDEQMEEVRKELDDIRDDGQDATDDADKACKKIRKYEEKIAKLQRKIEKEREEVADELDTAEEKSRRSRELEDRLRELQRARAKYLGAG